MPTPPNERGPIMGYAILAGLVAGAVFLLAWMGAAAAMGESALGPIRLVASLGLGEQALTAEVATGTAVLAGLAVHFVVSLFYAGIYGLVLMGSSRRFRTSYGREVILGLAFGAGVWLFNFQVFARAWWPWFLEANQPILGMLHAVFYGIPLAVAFVALERTRPSDVQIPV